jgi:hypothetical protein
MYGKRIKAMRMAGATASKTMPQKSQIYGFALA